VLVSVAVGLDEAAGVLGVLDAVVAGLLGVGVGLVETAELDVGAVVGWDAVSMDVPQAETSKAATRTAGYANRYVFTFKTRSLRTIGCTSAQTRPDVGAPATARA